MEIDKDNKEEIIKRKAEFYFTLNLKCHVKLKPEGFKNGYIISKFQEVGSFFYFRDLRFYEKTEKLFLYEIFDIKDYEEKDE